MISISKIKKISLIKKKWTLKGKWLLEIGSNPHSNGDIFSRLWLSFLEIKKLINSIIKEKIKHIKRIIIKLKINKIYKNI